MRPRLPRHRVGFLLQLELQQFRDLRAAEEIREHVGRADIAVLREALAQLAADRVFGPARVR